MTRRLVPAAERVGQRFGRLVILEATGTMKPCVAQCDCGTLARPILNSVVSGTTRSCGCLVKDTRHTTHRGSKTQLYKTYRGIISRCTSERSPAWEYYGGRGITICEGWRNSFESFRDDMGARPGPEFSIDRVDNSAGYWCGHCAECVGHGRQKNVRWATRTTQNSNTRKNAFLTIGGATKTQSEWAREAGISRQLLSLRISRGVTGYELIAPPNSVARHLRGPRHCSCCGELGHDVRNCHQRAA